MPHLSQILASPKCNKFAQAVSMYLKGDYHQILVDGEETSMDENADIS